MMNNLELIVETQEELPIKLKEVLNFFREEKIFLLNGEMGAGKTTIIKHFCSLLGSDDNFSSPTYSIVNEYHSSQGKIYHMDLFRLKNKAELLDLGFEEYIHSGNYCFIEWPALALDLVGAEYINIDIQVSENFRYIRASKMS